MEAVSEEKSLVFKLNGFSTIFILEKCRHMSVKKYLSAIVHQ